MEMIATDKLLIMHKEEEASMWGWIRQKTHARLMRRRQKERKYSTEGKQRKNKLGVTWPRHGRKSPPCS